MVLELEADDRKLLEGLVERYQKLVGPAGGKASRVFVIRQLIRHAAEGRASLPPVRG